MSKDSSTDSLRKQIYAVLLDVLAAEPGNIPRNPSTVTDKIMAEVDKASAAELESFREHCLEAFEPSSKGYALTIPELDERLAELKGKQDE